MPSSLLPPDDLNDCSSGLVDSSAHTNTLSFPLSESYLAPSPAPTSFHFGATPLERVKREIDLRRTNLGYGLGVGLRRTFLKNSSYEHHPLMTSQAARAEPAFTSFIQSAINFLSYLKNQVRIQTTTKRNIEDAVIHSLFYENNDQIDVWKKDADPYFREEINKYIEKYQQKISSLEEALEQQYVLIKNTIANAKQLAQKKNKPLLVLVGEKSCDFSSILLQAMTLNIFSEISQGGKLFTEKFMMDYYQGNRYIPEGKLHEESWSTQRILQDANPKKFTAGNTVEALAKQLKLKKIPMDYAGYDRSNFWSDMRLPNSFFDSKAQYTNDHYPNSALGMQRRSEVMVNIMSENNANNNIAIVDNDHISGMMDQESLSEHYHVLIVNTVVSTQEYFYNTDIINPTIKFDASTVNYFDKNLIIKMARNVQQRVREKQTQMFQPRRDQSMCPSSQTSNVIFTQQFDQYRSTLASRESSREISLDTRKTPKFRI